MKNSISNELQKINSSDFYMSGKIPKDKLKNAISSYPIPVEEDVLALIDATVFGSAKNGMAIGLKGVYWKNDWATATVKNFLHWNDLIANIKQMTVKGSDLILSPGCVFSLAGSSVKPKLLLDLFLNVTTKISTNNEPKLEILLNNNSQKSSIQPNGESLSNKNYLEENKLKKKEEFSPPTEKVVSEPIVDNRFSGKYDPDLLRLVTEISKKYRLSRHVYIPYSIPINKVKTILDICDNSISPFSIFVIVDNTFLQTGKDFLIVTDEFIASRSMVRKLDKFNLSEIRSISCNNEEFFINNHDFQFFDQLQHSEIRILVDFLNELIPSIRNNFSKSKKSNEKLINSAVSYILTEAFINVAKELNEEFNIENDPDDSEFLDHILKTLYAIFVIIEANFDSTDSCGKDYLLHQYLLAYICISAFAGSKIEEINENENSASCYLFSNISIIKNIIETGKNHGLYLKGDANKYLNTFKKIFASSCNNLDFYHILNEFLDSSPEDRKTIIISKKSISDAIVYLKNSFS